MVAGIMQRHSGYLTTGGNMEYLLVLGGIIVGMIIMFVMLK